MFESELERLRGEIASESCFFQPGSIIWRVSRERVLLFFGMRALLLQIAHPAIAQAVAEHSDFRRTPLKRGIRTFTQVYALLFGRRDEAIDAAIAIRRIHRRVVGTIPGINEQRYEANDPTLALWVAATLLDSALLAYEACIKPLSLDERETYYQQSKQFGQFFAVRHEMYPRDWPAFAKWFEQVTNELEVGATAREIYHHLLWGTWTTRIFAPLNYLVAAATLPAPLCQGFGLTPGPGVRVSYLLVTRLLRVFRGFLPDTVTVVGSARRREQSKGVLI